MLVIIGLTGPGHSGKSTLAQLLDDHGWRRMNFAEPIKNMLRTLLYSCHISIEETEARLFGSRKEEEIPGLGVSSRRLMQFIGTEGGRGAHPDLWLRAMEMRLANATGKVVIDDVRMDNEAEMIHRLGGKVYRIERSGGAKVEAHASEAGVASALIDGVVVNDSGKEDMLDELTRAMVLASVNDNQRCGELLATMPLTLTGSVQVQLAERPSSSAVASYS